MARRDRAQPEIEVPALAPAPETLIKGAGTAPATVEQAAPPPVAAPAQPAAPAVQPPESPTQATTAGSVDQPAVQQQPQPAATSVADSPPAPLIQAPPTVSAEQVAAQDSQGSPSADPSAALELRESSGLANQAAPQIKASGVQFEAVQIGSEDDFLQLQDASPKRSSHLGFRVTEAYHESFKANVHLIAALNRVPVETVNTVLLNYLARSFPEINAEVAKHKMGSGSRR